MAQKIDKNEAISSDNILARNQMLGQMIDAIDLDTFLRVFFEKLSAICPFEIGALMINRHLSKPICLYHNFKDQRSKQGLKNYLEYTYILNPFYQAYLNNIAPGVYRTKDLAPDAYFTSTHRNLQKISIATTEEMGYITEGWPKNREEISIAIHLEKNTGAEISLLRPTNEGFQQKDFESLLEIEPIIAPLIRSYWKRRESNKPYTTDNRINEAFENFGKSILTDRQRKVVQLILRGHSTQSISLIFEVATTTIKSHRKNAYMRLGISTQSELLSLFIDSLTK